MKSLIKTAIFLLIPLALISCRKAKKEMATRWSENKAQAWGKKQPWILGANYIPSDASNVLEFWQKKTWNPELIDKELGWAENIGMNTMRVFLHYFPYRDDKQGFLNRIDQFLGISSRHHIKVIFVFFDDVWNPYPKAGPQPAPRPYVHNSRWVQSPGHDILWNPARYKELKPYVQDILTRFRNDDRIRFWDLYNEPGNTNGSSYHEGKGKEKYSMMLLKDVFKWAREVNPSQPITSALWRGDWTDPKHLTDFQKFMFDHSDVITFHDYDNIKRFKRAAEALKRYHRPIICTEYMARGINSTFKTHLPYMAKNNIGAINWGLVAGKTQTIYPWDSWYKKYTAEPKLWFHDIFHKDGTPYRQSEVDLIKKLATEKNGK